MRKLLSIILIAITMASCSNLSGDAGQPPIKLNASVLRVNKVEISKVTGYAIYTVAIKAENLNTQYIHVSDKIGKYNVGDTLVINKAR